LPSRQDENAYQLYKTAVGMTDDPRMQMVLMNFADMELGHRRRLEAINEEQVLIEGWDQEKRHNKGRDGRLRHALFFRT